MNDTTARISLDFTPPTDAQICANWAREALAEGRYALGVELARLADRAARVGARPAGHDAAQQDLFGHGIARVPLRGQTRDEHPRAGEPQVCVTVLEENGSRRLCNAAIAWDNGWHHADPQIMDHPAEPGAGY